MIVFIFLRVWRKLKNTLNFKYVYIYKNLLAYIALVSFSYHFSKIRNSIYRFHIMDIKTRYSEYLTNSDTDKHTVGFVESCLVPNKLMADIHNHEVLWNIPFWFLEHLIGSHTNYKWTVSTIHRDFGKQCVIKQQYVKMFGFELL